MYECSICQSLNHASRLHCQNCGTIPARYSITGEPVRIIARDYRSEYIPVVVAAGAQRMNQNRTVRVNLRTVTLDYYAD